MCSFHTTRVFKYGQGFKTQKKGTELCRSLGSGYFAFPGIKKINLPGSLYQLTRVLTGGPTRLVTAQSMSLSPTLCFSQMVWLIKCRTWLLLSFIMRIQHLLKMSYLSLATRGKKSIFLNFFASLECFQKRGLWKDEDK